MEILSFKISAWFNKTVTKPLQECKYQQQNILIWLTDSIPNLYYLNPKPVWQLHTSCDLSVLIDLKSVKLKHHHPKKKVIFIKKLDNEQKLEKINNEIKRLNTIYSKIDKKSKRLIEGLIREAAYMRVTLEEYKNDLDTYGYIEMFSQSPNTDPYERERPVARLYNTMNKNYQCIIKQLADMMPKEEHKTKIDDGFDDFVNRRDDA
jgi:hypothetical protein